MDGIRERSPFIAPVREAIRVRHFSLRTEEAYVGWIRPFILCHGKRHPSRHTLRHSFATHLLERGAFCDDFGAIRCAIVPYVYIVARGGGGFGRRITPLSGGW